MDGMMDGHLDISMLGGDATRQLEGTETIVLCRVMYLTSPTNGLFLLLLLVYFIFFACLCHYSALFLLFNSYCIFDFL